MATLNDILTFFAALEDFHAISLASITFSGHSSELPTVRLRLRDDSVPERTEQFKVHLRLRPAELEHGLLLDNMTADIVILDDDGGNHTLVCMLYRCYSSTQCILLITTTLPGQESWKKKRCSD